MRQKDGFAITRIQQIPYLLPFGQNIAENRRGIRLNESGVFLWNALAENTDRDTLLQKYIERYGSGIRHSDLEQDMDVFLQQLSAYGVLEEDNKTFPVLASLSIGGLPVTIRSEESLLLHENLSAFSIDYEDTPKLTIICRHATSTDSIPWGGKMLIRTDELIVCENEYEYVLLFPQMKQIFFTKIKKDGTEALICYHPTSPSLLTEPLFHVMRFLYLYLAQKNGCYIMHSASILYQDRAWLFSGSSGTGKSTHTNMWQRLFHVPVINGDLNLITLKNGTAFVCGIPWCGTSGLFDTKDYPLGGIVHLKQSGEIKVTPLPSGEKALFTAQRLISPAWNQELFKKNIDFSEQISNLVPVLRLACRADEESAHAMKQHIDTLLQKGS